ncbi:MAG: response regulator, partial [Deltaproteobacteria bacterium]|nr:response regulator [Deltaproteobacteria bacterium]
MVAPRILIVEDEQLAAKHLTMNLTALGYEVVAAVSSGEAALQLVAETIPDLILMDIMLEGEMDGIETAEQIRSRLEIPVVFLTGYGDEDLVRRASRTRPYGYLLKPWREEEVRTTIEVALYKHKVDKEARLLGRELNGRKGRVFFRIDQTTEGFFQRKWTKDRVL